MLSKKIFSTNFLINILTVRYKILNFFDPMPKNKKNEGFQEYLRRIPRKYAIRHLNYQLPIYRIYDQVDCTDHINKYKRKKDQKTLKKLQGLVSSVRNDLEEVAKEISKNHQAN